MGFAGPVLRRPTEASAELPRSLSSLTWSVVWSQSWTAAPGDPHLGMGSLTPSAVCCCAPPRCWRRALLGITERPGGLDALPCVSKSHGSDLLVLLLDGGRSPLPFSGAVEERGFFSLLRSPLQTEFPGVVAPARARCGCCAECVVNGLSAAAPLWCSV